MFYNFKQGLTYHKKRQNLTVAFGDSVSLVSTVSHWFCKFKHGRQNLQDEPRSRFLAKAQETLARLKDSLKNGETVISVFVHT